MRLNKISIRILHWFSIVAIIIIMITAKIAYIDHDVAYIQVFGDKSYEIGQCYYRTNFGIECPSCGLTRSFISIEDLSIHNAQSYNPMGIFIYGLFILTMVFNVLSLLKVKFAAKFGIGVGIYGVLSCIALVIIWVIDFFIL